MTEPIRRTFDPVTMPSDCEEKILSAIRQKKNRSPLRPNYLRIATAAACFVALIFFFSNPTVVEALENIFSDALRIERIVAPGQQEIRYRSPDGKFTDSTIINSDGTIIGHGRNNLIPPAWLSEKDGRLFFTGNGETIDVTDLISMETPFTYTYTDSGGIIHYICIGGVYDPDPEKSSVGYGEWYYDTAEESPYGWIGGYADNYWNKETDEDWPWLKKAKEELGIPWQ